MNQTNRKITAPLIGFLLVCGGFAAQGCASRNYTHYLIQRAPKKNPALGEEGTLVRPMGFGSSTMMKARWNDGKTITEVEIPLLASGQRIVIEHGEAPEGVKATPATNLVPPPPTLADETLVEAYQKRGLRVNTEASAVSLTRAQARMNEALAVGNYGLALEWCALVLSRYPDHPEFLRAKASILLLMGERENAIEIYEAAEEIESDPAVRKKLEELQKGGN